MDKKDALKALRKERAAQLDRTRELVRNQNRDLKLIKDQLAQGLKTIPELAEAVGLPAAQTLWYVQALKKYGLAAEGEKSRRDVYYPYHLTNGNEQGKE